MAHLALVASIVGTAISAMGTIAAGKAQQEAYQQEAALATMQGKAAQEAANYQAAQAEARGKEEQAAAQQEAAQLQRNKELALSSLQAKSAASGFSATDPTTMQLADEIARYGTLQEQMAQWGGSSRRAGLEAAARGERWSGQQASLAGQQTASMYSARGSAVRKGSYFDAAGTILGGVSSLASKYAPPKPAATSSYRYG